MSSCKQQEVIESRGSKLPNHLPEVRQFAHQRVELVRAHVSHRPQRSALGRVRVRVRARVRMGMRLSVRLRVRQ